MQTLAHLPTRPRGLALVLALWLSVILITMVYALIADVQVEGRLQGLTREKQEARWLANAGVARAAADLANDMVIERSGTNDQFDARGDVWALGVEGKTDIVLSERDGAGFFTVEVTDAESRINLNVANAEVLTGLFIVLGFEEENEARRRAEAIIDWRDENTIPVSQFAEIDMQEMEHWTLEFSEEEGIFWDGIMHNGRFLSVDELLDIPGITPELFYGPETEEEDDSRSRRRRRRRDDEVAVGLRDCVTVASNGQININTARREVIGAMAVAALGPGTDWAQIGDAVIEHREGRRDDDPDDDSPFTNVNELASVPLAAGLLTNAGDYRLNVRSQNFIISSTGFAGSARHSVVTEVRRDWEVFVFNTVAFNSGLTQREMMMSQLMGTQFRLGAPDNAREETSRERRIRDQIREADDLSSTTPAIRFQTWVEH